LSVLVGDPYQGAGIGAELIRRVVEIAKQERVQSLEAILTVDNHSMQHIFEKLGFTIEPAQDPKLLMARLELQPAPAL
jgi:acetyltransferase